MKVPKIIETYYPSGMLHTRTKNYVKENEIRIWFYPELRRLNFDTYSTGDRASDIQQIFSQFTDIDFQRAVVEDYIREVAINLKQTIHFLETRGVLKYNDWIVTYEWD